MSSFTRYATVAAVVISLGFLVAAAPTPAYARIPTVTGKDAISTIISHLCVGLEVKIKTLASCATTAELQVAIQVLVSLFQGCANALSEVEVGVVVDAEAKASIVACVAAIITLCAQVCAQVSIKFGLAVVLGLFQEFDIVLRLCFVNLDICIDGIIILIAKTLASGTVALLGQIHLNFCLAVLGFAGIQL